MTNRAALLNHLSNELAEVLELNEIIPNVEPNSFIAGFQVLAEHIYKLIKIMEQDGKAPEEIIKEIQLELDNGPQNLVLN